MRVSDVEFAFMNIYSILQRESLAFGRYEVSYEAAGWFGSPVWGVFKPLAWRLLGSRTVLALSERNRREIDSNEGTQGLKPLANFPVYMVTATKRAKDNK